MFALLVETANKNLLLGFMPESLGLLLFGIGLIVFAVSLRWIFNRTEKMINEPVPAKARVATRKY